MLQETVHATHLLKLLGKMNKYEMDPTRTVAATERTCDAGEINTIAADVLAPCITRVSETHYLHYLNVEEW